MTDTILANATLVLPTEVIRGSLRLQDGKIAEIGAGTAVPAGALDCEGDLVMPGLIELHTDNLERHIEPRPKVDWPHAAAIIAHDAELSSVGITTVFDALAIENGPIATMRHARSRALQSATAASTAACSVSAPRLKPTFPLAPAATAFQPLTALPIRRATSLQRASSSVEPNRITPALCSVARAVATSPNRSAGQTRCALREPG